MKYFLLSFIFCALSLQARTFYMAPDGADANKGTRQAPFLTFNRAQQAVGAGDTVRIRGGVYKMHENQISANRRIYAMVNNLDKSGTKGRMIHYLACEGEKPVFDFSEVKPDNQRVIAFNVTGSWIHLKGFEVVGVQVTIKTHTQSECFHNEGSNNLYEQLAMHDGQGIGFYLTRGSDNLVLNCDAYRNWDYTSEGGRGGNADGFGCHPQPGSTGNVFRGCRAWFNSDDGYDCIRAAESVLFDHCWAFYNGYNDKFQNLADGNGFKAGGWGLKKDERVPEKMPMHTVQFCLAVGNKANGFYANHQPGGNYWFNNTAFRNGNNFNMLNRNADFTADVPGYGHILKNNLSYKARGKDIVEIDTTRCTLSHNSFFGQQPVATDFQNLDETQLVLPRNSDGSLPDITLLHLHNQSHCVDAGVDVGFPYRGKCPDLGAFERAE